MQTLNYTPGMGVDAFECQAQQVADLSDALSAHRQVVLTGAAGIGKTALARAYTSCHYQQYPGGVWWIDFNNGMASASACIASFFGWDAPASNQTTWLWERWDAQCPGKKLVVVDDVKSSQIDTALLPTQYNIDTVLTSRDAQVGRVNVFGLRPMDEASALCLLAYFVGDDRVNSELNTAKKIVKWVKYRPGGIETVGRHLGARPSVTLGKLWSRIESDGLDARVATKISPDSGYRLTLKEMLKQSTEQGYLP